MVNQKSIIRIIYLLKVNGSDLLFISVRKNIGGVFFQQRCKLFLPILKTAVGQFADFYLFFRKRLLAHQVFVKTRVEDVF